MRILVALVFSIVFMGCGGNIDYDKAATQSGVDQETLKRLCKGIVCNYDKLKDKIEAVGDDANSFMQGSVESRTIKYSWRQGQADISLTLFDVSLYDGWHDNSHAEIYIGKEMTAKLNSSTDKNLGSFNTTANTHEKIERIFGNVSIDIARKIAEADRETVTIRFYGKEGYNDVPLPRSHSLIQVVKLAETVR